MIAGFLTIRFRQLRRELAALGWWRAVLVVVAAAGLVAVFYRVMCRALAPYGAAALVACVAFVHLSRTDKRFILLTTASFFGLCLSEYLLFTAPFILAGLCSPGRTYMLFVPPAYAALCLVQWLPDRQLRLRARMPSLRGENFEWMSGIRQNIWPLAALYIACLGFVAFPYVSLYLWWLLMTVLISFYQEYEPLELLGCWELPPSAFLRKKLAVQLATYGWFSAPLFVTYSIVHPSGALIALGVWALSAISLSGFVLAKYAGYRPGEKVPGGSLLLTLVHLALLIPLAGPFIIPVPLALAARACYKSVYRLKPYLDAYR